MSEGRDVWNPSTEDSPSLEAVRFSEYLSNPSVLDVGCGWGRNLVPFRETAPLLHGFDLDAGAVKRAQQVLKESAPNALVWQDDLRSVELAAAYDLVMCYGVLHFLSTADRKLAYQNLRSWVKPGGYAVVVAFNAQEPIPLDLQPLIKEAPESSDELRSAFTDWNIVSFKGYTFDDEHDNGRIRHRHSIDRLVVQAPPATEG